jgi:ketosteroid isomerase-like protein
MSQENVEIVRRAYDALNRGDFDGALADASPDFEYVASGIITGAGGVYRGPEEFRRAFIEWFWAEFDEPRMEVREVTEAGDQVLVSAINRGRGRQSGVETSWQIWQLWTVRDGRIVRGRGFASKAEALKAVGLRE